MEHRPAGTAKQQMQSRVHAATSTVRDSNAIEQEQYDRLKSMSPQTLRQMIRTIQLSLKSFSPFSESVLLLAFKADPETVTNSLMECTRKVLGAPVQSEHYQWFMHYVFASTVWFKETKSGHHLFDDLLSVTEGMRSKVIQNMDSLLDHLRSHQDWDEMRSIRMSRKQPVIDRQDDPKVGLLRDPALRDLAESKSSDDHSGGGDSEGLKRFIDGNLALNMLMTTAQSVHEEFQREMRTILSRHGEFQSVPIMSMDDALSGMETNRERVDGAYPKAAECMDIVRCSVSFNTVNQLIDGVHAFTEHVQSASSSMKLARIRNGFADKKSGGNRDITVHVVYRSTVRDGLKMVVGVRFILNRFLFEERRLRTLDAITSQRTHFEMVTAEIKKRRDADRAPSGRRSRSNSRIRQSAPSLNRRRSSQRSKMASPPMTPRRMVFEALLTVRDDVDLPSRSEPENMFFKSTMQSQLGWLAMNCGMGRTPDRLYIVDLADHSLIFEHRAYGRYSHHWLSVKNTVYLSLQTAPHTVSMFKVKPSQRKLVEVPSLRIKLDRKVKIEFIEFDRTFSSIVIVHSDRGSSKLERRPLSLMDNKVGSVTVSIALEKGVRNSVTNLMALSGDGKWAVIASGGNAYVNNEERLKIFYLIDIEKGEQFKMTSEHLTRTYCPCFVNGDSQFVIGGSNAEGLEIWSVADRELVTHCDVGDDTKFVSSTFFANHVLAVGLGSINDGALKLYDTRSWDVIHGAPCHMTPRSLALTADSKYIAMGGSDHEKCIVLRIKRK